MNDLRRMLGFGFQSYYVGADKKVYECSASDCSTWGAYAGKIPRNMYLPYTEMAMVPTFNLKNGFSYA